MPDPRFFKLLGPFTLADLAARTGSSLSDEKYAGRVVKDVAPLDVAASDHLCFFDNKKYLDAFRGTKAGACFVRAEFASFAPEGLACLLHKNPYKAYAIAASAFYPAETFSEYRDPMASIHPEVEIGAGCFIEAGAVIEKGVKIGARTRIGAHAVISAGVEIGAESDIGSNAYVSHALIGARVRLYPGVSIGRPGFGFAMDATGFLSVPQLGRVLIGDDVEIGANTTVDRGAGPDTVIGQGTRIDNLVQIGHNVKIGKYCVIVAQTGISGSTEIGDFTMIGGQAGLAGHLKIGSRVKIAAQSGVMRDIPDGAEHMGSPSVPLRQFMKQTALLGKMSAKKAKGDA